MRLGDGDLKKLMAIGCDALVLGFSGVAIFRCSLEKRFKKVRPDGRTFFVRKVESAKLDEPKRPEQDVVLRYKPQKEIGRSVHGGSAGQRSAHGLQEIQRQKSPEIVRCCMLMSNKPKKRCGAQNRLNWKSLPLLVWLFCALGCSSSYLEGSIGDDLSLNFDYIRIRSQDFFMAVEFIRESVRGSEKVCKLVVDTEELDLESSGYAVENEQFLQHVELSRTTYENDVFPEVKNGSLNFENFGMNGNDDVGGGFLVLFKDNRTLRGAFYGSVEAF